MTLNSSMPCKHRKVLTTKIPNAVLLKSFLTFCHVISHLMFQFRFSKSLLNSPAILWKRFIIICRIEFQYCRLDLQKWAKHIRNISSYMNGQVCIIIEFVSTLITPSSHISVITLCHQPTQTDWQIQNIQNSKSKKYPANCDLKVWPHWSHGTYKFHSAR